MRTDKTTLKANIEADIPDNTSRLVSPADIRENLIDLVDSVPVLSGSFSDGDAIRYDSNSDSFIPISSVNSASSSVVLWNSSFSLASGILVTYIENELNVFDITSGLLVPASGLDNSQLSDQALVISSGDFPQTYRLNLSDINPQPPTGNYLGLGWENSQTIEKWNFVGLSFPVYFNSDS